MIPKYLIHSVLLSSALLLYSAILSAASIPVANGAVGVLADGVCSLVEAIQNANAAGQAHTDCGAGSAGENTVVLASNGSYTFDASTEEIPITGNLVINGNNATLMHLTAGFFDIAGTGFLKLHTLTLTGSDGVGASAISGEGSLFIANSAFTENVNQSTSGGAIDLLWNSSNKSLEIRNSTFQDNVAAFNGGAISVRSTATFPVANRAVLFDNVTFESNGRWVFAPGIEASNGGAVYLSFSLESNPVEVHVSSCLFDSNYAGSGGALYADDNVDLLVDRTTFNANEAKNQGGAIINRFGEIEITRSLLSNNTATNPGGFSYGGGFNNFKGTVTVINTTFSGNTADRGGAFRNYATDALGSSEAVVVLSHVTMTNNEARSDAYGGGFYNHQAGTIAARVNLQNTLILGNITPLSNKDCRNNGGIMQSFGYNVKSGSALAGCSYSGSGTGDVSAVGAASTVVNPLLADNGGATKTHAIPQGSEARNLIPISVNGCVADQLDQRNYLRNSGNATSSCDAGAYEWGAAVQPCVDHLVIDYQSLTGPQTVFEANSSVTLGPSLLVIDDIQVNAPTVNFVSDVMINSALSVGQATSCP